MGKLALAIVSAALVLSAAVVLSSRYKMAVQADQVFRIDGLTGEILLCGVAGDGALGCLRMTEKVLATRPK